MALENIRNLLQSDRVITWQNIPVCPKCDSVFTVYQKSGNNHRPLILMCDHLMCEKCVYESSFSKIAICKICNIKTPIASVKKFMNQFQYNFQLMGMINQHTYEINCLRRYPMDEISIPAADEEECFECSLVLTKTYCRECNAAMCSDCFTKIHRIGKTISKHKLFLLESRNSIPKDFKVCELHGVSIEYFCTVCVEKSCLKCNVDKHQGHHVETIAHENELAKPKLDDLITDLETAKTMNEQGIKDADNIITKQEQFANDAINEVTNYFVYLHCLLQTTEKEVLQNMKKHYLELNEKTTSVQNTLKDAATSFTTNIELLMNFKDNVPKHILLSDKMNQAKKFMQTLPCNVAFEGLEENPFKFHETAPLRQDIDKYFELKFENDFRAELTPFHACEFEDLSNDESPILEAGVSNPKSVNTNPKREKTKTSKNPKTKTSVVAESSKLKMKHKEPKSKNHDLNQMNADFIKNSQKVTVSYIRHPNEFYVQNQSFLSIASSISEMCASEAKDRIIPDKIKDGAFYLAMSRSEKKWFRAKVIKQNQKKYEIFFIDYGRRDEVSSSKILTISKELSLGYPAGAIRCTLFNILPHDGGKWSHEVKQVMMDFIDNKPMSMFIVEYLEPYQVDLISTSSECAKSLRNTLVYLGLCCKDSQRRNTEEKDRRIAQLGKMMENFALNYDKQIHICTLNISDIFRVKIMHSVSPSEFYICKNEWHNNFLKLQSDLCEFYAEKRKIIFAPHVGMICAFEVDDDDNKKWYRGRVLQVMKGCCEVLAVDTGRRQKIVWNNMFHLADQFLVTNEMAVLCKLVHVQPFKQHNYKWTEDAIDFFNCIAFSMNAFQICVLARERGYYEVTLYMIKKLADKCVNGMLVKSGLAVSTGDESIRDEIPKEFNEDVDMLDLDTIANKPIITAKEQSRRTRIEVLKIVSPGELYISISKNVSGMLKLQDEIQNKMDERADAAHKEKWELNDLCLVFTTSPEVGASEWYRARIEEVIDDSNYSVFLLDKAILLKTHFTNINTIPSALVHYVPGAIKCHLACVGPMGTSWASSTIDALKCAIEKFKDFYISVQGKIKAGTLPIILWGMKSETNNPLAPATFHYTNINNYMVQYGYVNLTENFAPLSTAKNVEELIVKIYEDFDKCLSSFNNELENVSNSSTIFNDEDNELDVEINSEVTPIVRWLPSVPIGKTIFCATPTYVDNNGVIYMHDKTQDTVFAKIKSLINKKYVNVGQKPQDCYYSNGQPCIARFHSDNEFYRATVQKAMSPKLFKIQFIDYGNIEECETTDLRKEIICGNVPTLATKYRLSNIVPKSCDGVWPTNVLDVIHSLIVGKMCQIRVDTDYDIDVEVIPCFITLSSGLDIINYLKEMELVERKVSRFEAKVDILHDSFSKSNPAVSPKNKLKMGANFDIGPSTSKHRPVEEQKDTFAGFDLQELYESYYDHSRSMIENDEEGVGDENNLNAVHFLDTWSHADIKLENEDLEDGEIKEEVLDASFSGSHLSFDPTEFDTSTQIEPPADVTRSTIHGYPILELDATINGFYCEVTNCISAFNLFVYPHISEHEKIMKELMAKIQTYAKTHRKCPDIELKMACLALFKQDGMWYRGIVEKHNVDEGSMEIFYVDYLNTENVSVKDILKCPINLRKRPLRNLQIQLHAVKANPRYRDDDIMRKLEPLIVGKRIYAKIIKHGEIPLVELYTDDKCQNLIYSEMINEKFFLIEN